jgi:hypothetical protein
MWVRHIQGLIRTGNYRSIAKSEQQDTVVEQGSEPSSQGLKPGLRATD